MEARKVYCEVIQGVVYGDRCLFKLSKMVEDNKSCENCILRELEKIKSSGEVDSTKDVAQKAKYLYSICGLASFLGKSDQTIRNWVKKGEIPAQKVGKNWHFKKEEIDLWISKKGKNIKRQELIATRTSRKEDIHPSDQNAGRVTEDE